MLRDREREAASVLFSRAAEASDQAAATVSPRRATRPGALASSAGVGTAEAGDLTGGDGLTGLEIGGEGDSIFLSLDDEFEQVTSGKAGPAPTTARGAR